MGVATGFLVEDAFAVEGVDADLAGGVDDTAVAEADADMDDAAVGEICFCSLLRMEEFS